MDAERVVVADLLRPRGVRGEVVALSQSDVPDRFTGLRRAQVRTEDGADIAVEVVEAWPQGKQWVLKFAGIDSLEEAQRFRGAELWVSPGERAALPAGEFYQTDLLGCRLIDAVTGTEIGKVEGWQQYGGPPLMESRKDGRELLIPFVPAICHTVDLSQKQITVMLPDGLLDL